MTPRSNLWWLAALLAGGGIIALWVAGSHRNRVSPPPAGVLSFGIGGVMTNSAGQALARLQVTNCNSFPVDYMCGTPQVRTNGSWSEVRIPDGGMTCLAAGAFTNIEVPMPDSSEGWRLPILWCVHGLYAPPDVMDTVRSYLSQVVGPLPPRVTRVRAATNFTPEFVR